MIRFVLVYLRNLTRFISYLQWLTFNNSFFSFFLSRIGIGICLSNTRCAADEDEDLNVDGDDTQIFGNVQYSERDVILVAEDSKAEDSNSLYLRNLVIGNNPSVPSPSTSSNTTRKTSSSSSSTSTTSKSPTSIVTTTMDSGGGGGGGDDKPTSSKKSTIKTTEKSSHAATSVNHMFSTETYGEIIKSLKKKIKEYESLIKNKSKCLICLDEFKVPVVSICCWHVHCEECWLRTLGARKLCPQCNMITSPTDLRRIYM